MSRLMLLLLLASGPGLQPRLPDDRRPPAPHAPIERPTTPAGEGVAPVQVAQNEPAPTDWGAVERRYQELRRALTRTRPPYRVWRRAPSELWVYDNRMELGIGMHAFTAAQVDLLRPLGIRLVRHTLYWGLMEKTAVPGQYDPAYLKQWDDTAALARQRGIELLVVVHGNPPGTGWANRRESYQRFARFMGEMARRWPGILFWELWNEMDGAFTDLFGHGVTPEVPLIDRGRHYAEMLKLAYPAIKRANPKAFVLTGGMTNWNEFPRGIYEGGGRDYFDIMNLHTYGLPVEWSVVMRGSELRQVMAEFGDGDRPFWNTELGTDAGSLVTAWGFPHDRGEEDGPAFDRMHREQWQGALRAALDTGLYAKVLPYQLAAGNEAMQDVLAKPDYAAKCLPAGRSIEDYGFGLVRRDGVTPRPAYEWLKEARLNRAIRKKPAYVTDVQVAPAPAGRPAGYRSVRRGDTLVIKGVRVDAYVPTRIRFSPR